MAAVRNKSEVTTVFKKGDRGEGVKALQNNLQTLGFSPGVPDGIFGSLSEEAIKAFQKTNSLPVDGIAGPLVLTKINELIKVKTMPAPAVDYKKLYEDAQKKLDEIKKIVG